jgi:molecular chaperone GrpE
MEQRTEDEYQSDEKSQDVDTSIDETQEEVITEVDDPLVSYQNQYSELLEKHLRLAADLENVRRRSVQDTEMKVTHAITNFARDLLEVADNFERALATQEGQIPEGIMQIKKQLKNVLEKQGIIAFSSPGNRFDPALHEAIAYIPSDTPEGTVIDEVCRGYTQYDHVIRCAKVTVSKGNEEEKAPNA